VRRSPSGHVQHAAARDAQIGCHAAREHIHDTAGNTGAGIGRAADQTGRSRLLWRRLVGAAAADAGGPLAPLPAAALRLAPETVEALAEVVTFEPAARGFPRTGTVLFSDLTPDLPALVLFGVDVEIKFAGH
jgi:hypothetical protein